MKRLWSSLLALSLAISLSACSQSNNSQSEKANETLTIYSGRTAEYMGSLFEDFTAETGIKLEIRYGDSAALAAQLLEEGGNTPADLFISQDAGALGAVSSSELLTPLTGEVLDRVTSEYRSPINDWVALTGRVRILAYAPDRVTNLPKTVDELTGPAWSGRLGIAPTNASFQTFITAMIQTRGEAATEKWLRGIVANKPKFFEKNSLIVESIDAGEIDAGLVNHYYVWEVSEELGRAINVKNSFFAPGDIGNLVNVSGIGVLRSSQKSKLAESLIQYLLRDSSQKFFVENVHEYSIVNPELKPEDLPALTEVKAPKVQLAQLSDLQRTQKLLIKVGLL